MMMLFKIFYREMPVKEYQTRYAFTEFHLKFSIFKYKCNRKCTVYLKILIIPVDKFFL